jgi:hypothetical protein
MIRIRAFGCSLTAYHNWQYLVTDHFYKGRNKDPNGGRQFLKLTRGRQAEGRVHPNEWTHKKINLIDYSMASWCNDVEHLYYANEVYHENILKDDIILWQISSPDRVLVNADDSSSDNKKFHNVFTGEDINLVLTQELSNTTTYNTLWQLNGIKRNNDKLLVIFGWDSCFINSEKNEIMKFLKEHDIDYIEESILGWTHRHKFIKKDTRDMHPPQEGYKSFTEDCLLPKLKKLKWLV